jgi:hypothetical protein
MVGGGPSNLRRTRLEVITLATLLSTLNSQAISVSYAGAGLDNGIVLRLADTSGQAKIQILRSYAASLGESSGFNYSLNSPLAIVWTVDENGTNNFFVNGLKLTGFTGSTPAGNVGTPYLFCESNRDAGDATSLNGSLLLHADWADTLSDSAALALSANPWQIFQQAPRVLYFGASAGAGTTHTGSGTITGSGASVVGSASHKILHTASGTIHGNGSSLVGSANRFHVHSASGTIHGTSANLIGTAAHKILHTSSGVLIGSGASIIGAASNTAPNTHNSTGVLSGIGASLLGTAVHTVATVTHTSSGVLQGAGSQIVGTATHKTLHTATGILYGAGAKVTGHAIRTPAGGGGISTGAITSGFKIGSFIGIGI